MPTPRRTIDHPSPWRRIAATAVLALQAVFALAPMWEPRHVPTMGVHAEQPGARHIGSHDESGCAVCAARSMQAEPPAEPGIRVDGATQSLAANVESTHPDSLRGASIHLSRAPPPLA